MLVDDLFKSRSNFGVGDPVIITGNVEYRGKTGDVREIGRDGAFVVVDLYNYGPYSFHTSDVSYNDYADRDDEAEYQQGVAEGLPQTLRKVVPGYAKREIDKKMDAGKFGRDDVAKDANYYRYKKIQDKIKEQSVAEQDQVGNMPADRFDSAMARLKQLAGAGPLKTVWDPQKRVYKNVPTAVQPKK